MGDPSLMTAKLLVETLPGLCCFDSSNIRTLFVPKVKSSVNLPQPFPIYIVPGCLVQWLKPPVRHVMGLIPSPVKSDTVAYRQRLATAEIIFGNCVAQAVTAEMDPATCFTLRCNTASIMKILRLSSA